MSDVLVTFAEENIAVVKELGYDVDVINVNDFVDGQLVTIAVEGSVKFESIATAKEFAAAVAPSDVWTTE